ncbi:MAG TPA: IPT/TIG domain-containing protein [Solirubrobacteraceae bacterium]|nr:IPT/TIG domain-containing protein [Solirubrobacteraceae bacterium]
MARVRVTVGAANALHAAAALALLACALPALGAFASSSALAAQAPAAGPPGYGVRRVCGPPRPLAAACTALRLVPLAHGASGRAQAQTGGSGAGGAGGGAPGVPAVESTSPPSGFFTPQQLHAAYDLPTETELSAGQTVAVIDAFNDPSAEADLGVYDEQFGLPACTRANGCFRELNQEGQASPLPAEQGEWAGEISIDVQMVHAICQDCRVLLVEAESESLSDLADAVSAAVEAGATEVSNSYESPEEPAMASFYEELNAESYDQPGVAITAASGDCGYLNTGCSGEPATANFPADSPDVVAVGGTELRDEGETWTSSVWPGSGGGCSQVFSAPAWQLAVANFAATGCGTQRSLVDVAADGDPQTGVDIYDSTPEGNGEPTGWTSFGGTSVSAPIIAAEFALAGGAQNATHPPATLYLHAGEAGAFYDVVSGSNGSCGGASSCQAAVGYDGPSGLGSPLGLGAFAAPETPTLGEFKPSSGITGSTVTLDGTGLTAVSGVEFGMRAAQFTVVSSSEIEAIVPDGASRSAITLVTPAGPIKSKAKFLPTLSVTSFTPKHGAAGTVVTIKGVGFDAHSSVGFDGTPAHVESASKKKLKAKVPAGAGAGRISVTNTAAPAGTVSSADSYTP